MGACTGKDPPSGGAGPRQLPPAEISLKESALGTRVQSFECQTKEYKIECDTKHWVLKKYFSAVYESSD